MGAGRPPIYDRNDQKDIDRLSEKIDDYFASIYDDEEKKFKEPPTIVGLTLHIGFSSKDTLYNYKDIPEFSYLIKRGISLVEKWHEIKAAYGDKCVGNIFVLKNMGWKDKSEVDNNTNMQINWSENKSYESDDKAD